VESSVDARLLASSARPDDGFKIALLRNFEFKLPLEWLLALPPAAPATPEQKDGVATTSRLRLRFSLWQNGLPADALPPEGWIELQLLSEVEMDAYGT